MTKRTTLPGLIVAAPGPLRSALHSLLISLPEIDSIEVADQPGQVVFPVMHEHPLLILMVPENGAAWEKFANTARYQVPGSLLIILTDHVDRKIDADLILQQGIHPKDLIAAVEQLMERYSDH